MSIRRQLFRTRDGRQAIGVNSYLMFRMVSTECACFVRELLSTRHNSSQHSGEKPRDSIGINWGQLGALPLEISLLTGCSEVIGSRQRSRALVLLSLTFPVFYGRLLGQPPAIMCHRKCNG
jgi:hypothetical protein